ncbi:MAG: glycosyltransferase [Casimicrobiaceae bacterium]
MDPPRVSIIIRSMGRPELAEALASIAKQSYASIEVVVVDATGGQHPPLPETCGAFPVLVVDGAEPRSRPIAANAGLDAARGDFLAFLDDDDLIEPVHIAGLLAELRKHPHYAVAYSHAREVVDGRGNIVRRAQSYSRMLLFQDCYFQMSSAVFRREILRSCRFDERLEVCEDWDFWLQASAVSDFLVVPQETAVYRSALGRSGMGSTAGGNLDRTKYEHFRAQVAAKWQSEGERLSRNLEAAFDDAYALFANGDHAGAAEAANTLLGRYPYHVRALSLGGTIAALRGKFDDAARHFRVAVDEIPEDPAAHFNLAQALQRLGRAADARAHYWQVVSLDPSHHLARTRLAALDSQSR